MNGFKTSAAAKELNVSYYRLIGLLRSDKIPRPNKDSSGDYVWTENDLNNARRALESNNRRSHTSG